MNIIAREEQVREHMERSEKIAMEMFDEVRNRLIQEKLTIADSLHIGIILSSCLIAVASKNSSGNVSQEEILKQYTDALADQILERDYEVYKTN